MRAQTLWIYPKQDASIVEICDMRSISDYKIDTYSSFLKGGGGYGIINRVLREKTAASLSIPALHQAKLIKQMMNLPTTRCGLQNSREPLDGRKQLNFF